MPAKAAASAVISVTELVFHPVIAERWPDLERLFGERGACGGCWCMWWRLTRSQFDAQKGQQNKAALKQMIEAGTTPGILAYAQGEPVGWCAIEPRERYSALERSRILKPVDDQPVWSVTCFFIARPFRRKGMTTALLQAAVAYAKEQGANIVEGYPFEPKAKAMPEVYAFTGLASAFRKAGFAEVLRRSEARPIMRYSVVDQAKEG